MKRSITSYHGNRSYNHNEIALQTHDKEYLKLKTLSVPRIEDDMEQMERSHCSWEYKMVQTLWKTASYKVKYALTV